MQALQAVVTGGGADPSGPAAEPIWALPGRHVELPLDRVADYPVLAACLEAWRRLAAGRLPAAVDPLLFPRTAIRGLNLFEFEPAADDWRIRVVGGLVTDHAGRELRGTGLVETFRAGERDAVRAGLHAAARRAVPDLVRREFTDPRGLRWSYVRLYLPLSRDGRVVDRFATVIDPASFGRIRETDSED